jgi:hypothetical protein
MNTLLIALLLSAQTAATDNVTTVYLLPPRLDQAVGDLTRHDVPCQVLREEIELDIDVFRVDEIRRDGEGEDGRNRIEIRTTRSERAHRFPAGTIVVVADEQNAERIANLVEPESADGLLARRMLGDDPAAGEEYPIVRLGKPTPLLLAPLGKSPPAEKKPITFETLHGDKPVNFSGSPAAGFEWLEDGQHFLWRKSGQLQKVHAVSGRCEPFLDTKLLVEALAKLPTIDQAAAEQLAGQSRFHMNRDRTAVLFDYQNDLYLARIDGTRVARTRSRGPSSARPSRRSNAS